MNRHPRLENLKPYKKGQSGNPKGRPKTLPDLKEVIARILTEEQKGMTGLEALVRSLLQRGVRNDTRAATDLLDRYYGKPMQTMDMNLNSDGIKIQIYKDDTDL